MANVIMYTTAFCPYCVRARQLLNKKGVPYTDLRIDQNPSLRPEMEKRAKRDSVPQIFIDDRHIGGFDDMFMLEMDGELDELLGLA